MRTLTPGEPVRGQVEVEQPSRSLADQLLGATAPIKSIFIYVRRPEKYAGRIDLDGVTIRCVPRNEDFVRKHFPDLPALEWQAGIGPIV